MIQDINNCLESNNNNKYIYNNLINIDDNLNEKENNENSEISDNELLSSYNSLNLKEQNPIIYYKKRGKKQIKNRFNSEMNKENINKKKYSLNNANLNNHQRHYLKLSECLQFNY